MIRNDNKELFRGDSPVNSTHIQAHQVCRDNNEVPEEVFKVGINQNANRTDYSTRGFHL